MKNGQELITAIEEYAPSTLALSNDPIGLQIGSADAPVHKILLALEATEAVLAEAIEQQANWLVTHHPLIYKPLKALTWENPSTRLIAKIFQHQLNLFAAHTNLDITNGGINDILADKICLNDLRPFIVTNNNRLQKLVVFVPTTHRDSLIKALAAAGAGQIGNYSHCTFSSLGTGSFKPEAGSNPFVGNAGELEEVDEFRLETIFPYNKKQQVLQAMLATHPYEEVAYDIYELARTNDSYGLGRIGRLSAQVTLREFCQQMQNAWQLAHMRFVGDPDKKITTVAILGGAGARYLKEAYQQGVDLYITGDVDYHTAKEAEALDIALVDPGHHIEYLGLEGLANHLKQKFSIVVSKIPTDPFNLIKI